MHANKVACKTPKAGLTQPPSGMLRDVHPNPGIVRRGRGGGTAHALRAVRQFMWLGVDSGKMALSRPGRAPGWCPIPPMLCNTPQKACGA